MDPDKTVACVEVIEEGEAKTIRLTPTGKISHAKTRVYTQRYRKEWEHTPDFKDWLTSVPFQATRAFCRFCQRNLHAHRLSLLKHMCTLKHQRAAVQYAKRRESLNGEQEDDELGYAVEQVDSDEGEDDGANYDDSSYILEEDEEEVFEEHEEEVVESENENGSPDYKKMRIQNDDGQDALARAIADVNPDLLDENDEDMQFEVVEDADQDHEDEQKQFQIIKCESVAVEKSDDVANVVEISSKNTSAVKDVPKVSYTISTNRKADSLVVDSKNFSTVESSKKVLVLSSGGKSFTVLKGKLPQFSINRTQINSIVKQEPKSAKVSEKKVVCTSTGTSQEFNNKINNYSNALAATTKSILMKKPSVSTYVLETSKGIPVSGLQIILYKLDDGRWKNIHEGYTSANGTYDFSSSARNNLSVGRYRLHYDVEKYYSLKKIATIYPFIEIVFDIKDPGASYNIPLLMSPFSYSTFKDSPR